MTPDERLARDLFLAELWPTCRELPREERAVERALAADPQAVEKGREKAS